MKNVIAVSLMMILAIANTASASISVYTEWRGADGGDWNIASNWSNGVPVQLDPPGGPQGAYFGKAGFKGWNSNNGVPSAGLYSGTVAVDQIVVGGVTPGAAAYGHMNLDGATINVSEFIHIGNAAADNGTVTINSGTLNCGVMITAYGFLRVGFQGTGTLNMNGGNINLTRFLGIADGTDATANGTVNLLGGVINATDLKMNSSGLGVAKMYIGNGVLRLTNAVDLTGKIQTWINNGIINGAAGYEENVFTEFANGVTTVYAIPEPATIALFALGVFLLRKR